MPTFFMVTFSKKLSFKYTKKSIVQNNDILMLKIQTVFIKYVCQQITIKLNLNESNIFLFVLSPFGTKLILIYILDLALLLNNKCIFI